MESTSTTQGFRGYRSHLDERGLIWVDFREEGAKDLDVIRFGKNQVRYELSLAVAKASKYS